jgi:hypothetical protein
MFPGKSRQEVVKGDTNMKTTMILGAAVLGVAVAGGGLALAGQAGGGAAGLPAEIKNMGCLVGEWKGTGQLVMGDTKADMKLAISCKWQSAGHAVACQARFSGPPAVGTLEESDLFGFEPNTRKYHWFSVTSLGEVHDHVAEIPNGEVIDWVFNGTQEGKPYKETIRFEFSKDSKQLTFKTDTTVGGASQGTLTGTLKK